MYYAQGTGSPSCLRCAFGYKATVAFGTPHVYSCALDAYCNSGSVLAGLPSYLNAMTSCHLCSNDGSGQAQYPRLVVSLDGTNAYWYKLLEPGSGSFSPFACAAPNASQLVSNCAYYGFVLASADTALAAQPQVCLSCQPNYRPAYAANGYQVTSCAAISNCVTTAAAMFNGCAAGCLSSGSSHYAYGDYSLASCSAVGTANCLVATGAGLCQHCKADYYLNVDGQCETLAIPHCVGHFGSTLAPQKLNSDLLTQQQVRVYYHLALAAPTFGCSQCGAGYSHVMAPGNGAAVCLLSGYLASSPTLPAASNYLPYCASYNTAIVNGKYTCLKCQSGYMLTLDSAKCVAQLPNCLYA